MPEKAAISSEHHPSSPHSRLLLRDSFLAAPSKTADPLPPQNPAAPPGAGTCRGPPAFARSRAMPHTGPSGNNWQNRGLRDVLRPACRPQTLARRRSFLRSASGKRLPHPPPAPNLCRTANPCTAGRSLQPSSFALSLSGARREGVGRTGIRRVAARRTNGSDEK